MKLYQSWKLVLTLVFITFSFFASVLPVVAQTEQKFTGLIIRTPAEYNGFTYEFYMNHGETKCDSFVAQHDFQQQTKAATYYTLASDLEIDPESRRPIYPKNQLYLDHPFSLARWVTFEIDKVVLPEWGTEQRINFCVTVPADAAPGSHYAVLLLSNVTKEQYLNGDNLLDENAGAAIGSRLGVNLIVNVGGALEKNLQIDSLNVLDIDHQSAWFNVFEYLPINVVAVLHNEGNQFAKPAGNISIHQGDISKPSAIFPFNPGAARILPGTEYDFTTSWTDAALYIYKHEVASDSPSKTYENRLGVDFNNLTSFRFGRYYATLQLTYYDINGDFKRIPDYTVEFWIIPWKLLLIPTSIAAFYVWMKVRDYQERPKAKRPRKYAKRRE